MDRETLPILYSFRRCPYAIRARLAIRVSGIQVELREVVLSDKPKEMLAHSPKGTVPVLVLPDQTVIDESRDIMLWALEQNDPDSWLSDDLSIQKETSKLIEENDGVFKTKLDRYKYADRFPEKSAEEHRHGGEVFLSQLEDKLSQYKFLMGNDISLADMAVLPFIRQFAHVDKDWFYQTDYTKLKKWLDFLLSEKLFSDVLKKYPQWHNGDARMLF